MIHRNKCSLKKNSYIKPYLLKTCRLVNVVNPLPNQEPAQHFYHLFPLKGAITSGTPTTLLSFQVYIQELRIVLIPAYHIRTSLVGLNETLQPDLAQKLFVHVQTISLLSASSYRLQFTAMQIE